MGKYFISSDVRKDIRIPQKVIFRETYEEHLKRFAIVAASIPPEIVENAVSLLETYAGHDDLEKETSKHS